MTDIIKEQYTASDFATRFAHEAFAEFNSAVDHSLPERYPGLEIMKAVEQCIERKGHIPDKGLKLDDGRNISGADIANYLHYHNQKIFMDILFVFEQTFSNNPGLHNIADILAGKKYHPDRCGFKVCLSRFPGAATIIYSEIANPMMRILNGELYGSIIGSQNINLQKCLRIPESEGGSGLPLDDKEISTLLYFWSEWDKKLTGYLGRIFAHTPPCSFDLH